MTDKKRKMVSRMEHLRIYVRHNDGSCMFAFGKDGRAIVNLVGYMICPRDMFTDRQVKAALKKYHARLDQTQQ